MPTSRHGSPGPVFNRIFNTPGGGYADKFKHVIEPSSRFSGHRNRQVRRIVKLDGVDYVVGGTTQCTYGLTNRLLAPRRRRIREILTSASITQSYYTDENAERVDRQYQSRFVTRSVEVLAGRADGARGPPNGIQRTFRTEWDTR